MSSTQSWLADKLGRRDCGTPVLLENFQHLKMVLVGSSSLLDYRAFHSSNCAVYLDGNMRHCGTHIASNEYEWERLRKRRVPPRYEVFVLKSVGLKVRLNGERILLDFRQDDRSTH
jgi:hypothetical protein